MKQVKSNEVRLTRADLIAYIAERDRQRAQNASGQSGTRKSTKAGLDGMRWCYVS